MAETQDAADLAALYDLVRQPAFTLRQRHFFYWQLITKHAGITGPGAPQPARVYAALLDEARKAVNVTGSWLPPSARDAGRVVVITNQLLTLSHAPTADCMDYCHVLQTQLGRQVLLINTGDMPWTEPLPYYEPVRFNHSDAYASIGRLQFRGAEIPFYQCKQPMPDAGEMRAILGTIYKSKPAFVFSLGHSNVAADVCAAFLTVATMPFGTNLPRARSSLFLLPRQRRREDASHMDAWDIRDEQVIETEYTFRLPERSASFTRAQLGIPADAYAVAVVGNRLQEEITIAVAAELERVAAAVPQVFFVFMGTFGNYSALTDWFRTLAGRSVFVGHQQDVLAVLERCDAYWNPPRYGGGSSAAFALGMGLPVMTGPSGDVANIAGEQFFCATEQDVAGFIQAQLASPAHRQEWREAALRRFARISDREAMLRQIVQDVTAKADVRASEGGA